MKACEKLPAIDVLEDTDEENNNDADFDLSVEDLNPSEDPAVIGDEAAP